MGGGWGKRLRHKPKYRPSLLFRTVVDEAVVVGQLNTPSAVWKATTATSSSSGTQAVDTATEGANSHLGRRGDSNHSSASPIDVRIRTSTTSPLRALIVLSSREMSDELSSAAS